MSTWRCRLRRWERRRWIRRCRVLLRLQVGERSEGVEAKEREESERAPMKKTSSEYRYFVV